MRRDNPKRIQVYDADALTLIKHPTKPARRVDLADISKIEPCEDESRWHEKCLIHTVSRSTGKTDNYELREAEQLLAHMDKRRLCKVKKCYWQYETPNPPASCRPRHLDD